MMLWYGTLYGDKQNSSFRRKLTHHKGQFIPSASIYVDTGTV
jgi:hypothetical protein